MVNGQSAFPHREERQQRAAESVSVRFANRGLRLRWRAYMSVTATASPEAVRAGFESSARHLTASIEVTVEWLAAHPLSVQSAPVARKKYFDQSPHTSLYSQLGVPEAIWLTPTRYIPRQGFHRLATRGVGRYLREQVRLPYDSIALSSKHVARITNVSAELFPGDILITRIAAKASLPCIDLDDAILSLGELRSPKTLPIVDGLIRAVSRFIQGTASESIDAPAYSSYFAIQVNLPRSREEFRPLVQSLRQPLAALLIGTEGPELLRDGIVERVWAASEELNAKAATELLLLNRQGFLYTLPSSPYKGPHLHRFGRTRDLALIGMYAREFLRGGHAFSISHRSEADDIVRRMRQWINYPRTTFDASVSHTWSWLTVVDQLLLTERLDAWEDYFGRST